MDFVINIWLTIFHHVVFSDCGFNCSSEIPTVSAQWLYQSLCSGTWLDSSLEEFNAVYVNMFSLVWKLYYVVAKYWCLHFISHKNVSENLLRCHLNILPQDLRLVSKHFTTTQSCLWWWFKLVSVSFIIIHLIHCHVHKRHIWLFTPSHLTEHIQSV